MLRLTFSTLILIISCSIFAQTEVQLKRLAKATCGCMATKDMDNLDATQMQAEVGACMLNIVSKDPDAKTLMNYLKDAKSGQAFGEKIGIKLAEFCPDLVMKMATKMDPEAMKNAGAAPAENVQTATATVKEVRIGELVTFVTTDEKGREMKFVWLESFDGDATLMGNPDSIKGKKVEFSFKIIDKYDPRLKEYIPMKVLTGVKMM